MMRVCFVGKVFNEICGHAFEESKNNLLLKNVSSATQVLSKHKVYEPFIVGCTIHDF